MQKSLATKIILGGVKRVDRYADRRMPPPKKESKYNKQREICLNCPYDECKESKCDLMRWG